MNEKRFPAEMNNKLWAAIFCCMLMMLIAQNALSANPDENITILWKCPAADPSCLALTRDGSFCGILQQDDEIRLVDSKGNLVWKQRVDAATDILVANDGEITLIFSRLDHDVREVSFIRGDGKLLWSHRVNSAVWDAAVSPNGKNIALTTDDQYLYLYTMDSEHPRYRRWKLDGIGICVTFSADGEKIAVGTSKGSGISCYNINRKLIWHIEQETDQQYKLHTSMDGKYLLGISPGRQTDPGLMVEFRDLDGTLKWKQMINGFDGRARISPRSRYVALSYAKFLRPDSKDIVERKVAVFGLNGKLIWEKGGLFFGPRLVSLSPSGSSVITWDGNKSLYKIDRRGKILSKLSLGSSIRNIVPSEDGRRILAYCTDQQVYMLCVD